MGLISSAWHHGISLVHHMDHAVLEPVAKTVVVPLYKKAVKGGGSLW